MCGDGEKCGTHRTVVEEGTTYIFCDPKAGTCKKNHGTCGCHLFQVLTTQGHEKDKWSFAADPGDRVAKEDNTEYKCICTKKSGR